MLFRSRTLILDHIFGDLSNFQLYLPPDLAFVRVFPTDDLMNPVLCIRVPILSAWNCNIEDDSFLKWIMFTTFLWNYEGSAILPQSEAHPFKRAKSGRMLRNNMLDDSQAMLYSELREFSPGDIGEGVMREHLTELTEIWVISARGLGGIVREL